MIYPAHQGAVQISHVHNAALSREIGERLVISLNQNPVGIPPRLLMLMRHLRDETPEIGNLLARLPGNGAAITRRGPSFG
jgi:hypothetical protein